MLYFYIIKFSYISNSISFLITIFLPEPQVILMLPLTLEAQVILFSVTGIGTTVSTWAISPLCELLPSG